MKNLLLFFTINLNLIAYSQIQRVELMKCERIGFASQGAFDIINEKCSDGNYKFSFRDMSYMKITVGSEFKFKDIDGAYDNLFTSIIQGFETRPKDGIAFELPNEIVLIKYMSSLGIKGVAFFVKNKNTGIESHSNYFLKNQIYKLFGKKRD